MPHVSDSSESICNGTIGSNMGASLSGENETDMTPRQHNIQSTCGRFTRDVLLFRGSADESGNCCIFLDGELYTDRVKAPDIIREALAAGSLPLMDCLYLPNASAAGRHADYTCHEGFAAFVAVDLPRWIEREAGRFERLFLGGLSLSGLQAVFTALRHPGVFSGVLSQSPSAWWQDESLARSLIPADDSRNRFWLSVGTQELQENVSHPPTPLHQKTSQLGSVRRLASAMTDASHEIHCHEYVGGHDPVCWGAELPHALAWLMKS